MSLILSLGLRIPPIRRLLGRMHWPRPEHLDRLSKDQFHAYVRAIGIEAESKAALAEYRREGKQSEAVTGVLDPESRPDRPASAAVR